MVKAKIVVDKLPTAAEECPFANGALSRHYCSLDSRWCDTKDCTYLKALDKDQQIRKEGA